jgi:hypothetical protein
MSVYTVAVDVATHRPPTVDNTIYYRVEAESGLLAELTALQWAASRPGVVMPVGSFVFDWETGSA